MVWRATAKPADARAALLNGLRVQEREAEATDAVAQDLVIGVPVKRLMLAIALIAGTFLALDLVLQTVNELMAPPVPGWGKLVKLFNVSRETALPTWYSIIAVLTCAMLLAVIATAKWYARDRFRWHWVGLSLIFLGISIDEQIMVHEGLATPVRNLLNTGGIFYYAWVIPAILFLTAFAAIYLRFVLNLPEPFRRLFVLAALLYVGGALGMEMVGSWLADTRGVETLTYQTVATIEEIGEMSGIAVFLYGLLNYLRRRIGPITVNLS